MEMTLPTAVYVIWWATLLIVTIVVVPLAIGLLHRTLLAAQSIRRYFAEMLAAATGVAENAGAIPALEDTLDVAGGMLATADSLKSNSATLAGVLARRAEEGPTS